MSLLISTSPCTSLDDVGFHRLQDSAATQSQAESHSIQSTPWLMLPSDQEGDFTTSRFFNLAEKKVYKMKDAFGAFGDDV